MDPEKFTLVRLDPFMKLSQNLKASAILTRLAITTLSRVERDSMSGVQEGEPFAFVL
jgi:hypothetical protein